MQLRTQIIIILVSIVIVMMTLSSIIQYRTAKRAHLTEIQNHLKSLSTAKRLRFTGLISKRQEQLIMLQTREQLRENFALYLQTGSRATQLSLKSSITRIRDRMPSFKEIHLVALDGRVISSTENRMINTSFTARESFNHAVKGELCLHETFYDKNRDLTITMAGILEYEEGNLGVIMVEMEADDIQSIINDYSGLGETGETTIARRLPGGKIYYITPTRFQAKPGDSLIIDVNSGVIMDLAIRGVNGIRTEAVDYRNETVIAVPSYINEIGWGMVTKIDLKEAMQPINNLLYNTLMVTALFVVIVTILAYLLSGYLVKPIEELCRATWNIAQGKQYNRVNYSSKNEVGKLAANFNLMADRLQKSDHALTSKIEELDRSNDALNRFAYIVSHDLKSPVHSINGLMLYLKKKLGKTGISPDIEHLIELTEQKSQHMLNLINGILNYAKVGAVETKEELLEVDALIRELLPHLDIPAHIEVSIKKMPAIVFEKVLLIQVFQNLIGNAVKYMDKALGYIVVDYAFTEGLHRFSVSDNGRGIEKRYFEKIFDLFNKTHQLEGIDSSGIGLSIVKKIIESRGGTIWLESELGTGSTFYFTIPPKP